MSAAGLLRRLARLEAAGDGADGAAILTHRMHLPDGTVNVHEVECRPLPWAIASCDARQQGPVKINLRKGGRIET